MKYYLLIILALLLISSVDKTEDSNKVSVLQLKEIIKKSNKEFNLIYTYVDWCAPCVKEFPTVIKYCKQNNINLFIIIQSKEGTVNLAKFKDKFKEKYNFEGNLYNFSFDKALVKTVKKSNYRNYQVYIKELIGENYKPELIYSSDNFILMNNNLKIIYISEYTDYNNIYKKISELIKS